MLTNTKTILRPKVRFSECSDNMPSEESVQHFEEKVMQENGPRVKSIEILKKPVKIVYPKQVHNKDISMKYATMCIIKLISLQQARFKAHLKSVIIFERKIK
jgi:hypothetical protein